MGANIEIKARARDPIRQRRLAEAISDRPVEIIEQADTFFNVQRGRLKLRQFDESRGELIYYERADESGPKRSNYYIVPVADVRQMLNTLAAALGVRGVVRKTRHLYLCGRTRIHIDLVESLGWFIELEIVMEEGESDRAARAEAAERMRQLQIDSDDLIDRAYVDLLNESVGA